MSKFDYVMSLKIGFGSVHKTFRKSHYLRAVGLELKNPKRSEINLKISFSCLQTNVTEGQGGVKANQSEYLTGSLYP